MATAEANDNNNKSVVEMGYETTLVSFYNLCLDIARVDFYSFLNHNHRKGYPQRNCRVLNSQCRCLSVRTSWGISFPVVCNSVSLMDIKTSDGFDFKLVTLRMH